MSIVLGNNDFFGVPFPLVIADRFFHIYQSASGLKLDIFRWDETNKQAVYEVKDGISITYEINNNPTGIVTFSEPTRGSFLYKFRPKKGISQIFGKIPINDEFGVEITDHRIIVKRADKQVYSLERNQFSGTPIGIQIDADGSINIGVNKLPEGMILKRK
jgi:hypothetical protein